MREWIPISTSAKARLALAAVRAFGSRPYDAVSVGELARDAEVTTGALYHHFASKLGLYEFVRRDVERRLLDRMEGAATLPVPRLVTAVLGVGFDFAVDKGFQRILADPPGTTAEDDALVHLLDGLVAPAAPPLGRLLAAAWRAAVLATCDGGDVDAARAALFALGIDTGSAEA